MLICIYALAGCSLTNMVFSMIDDLCDCSYFTADTYANEHSARAARLAAGLCADLASAIVSGRAKNGFALVWKYLHQCPVPYSWHSKSETFEDFFLTKLIFVPTQTRSGLLVIMQVSDRPWDSAFIIMLQ